jgi:hypothetical protein
MRLLTTKGMDEKRMIGYTNPSKQDVQRWPSELAGVYQFCQRAFPKLSKNDRFIPINQPLDQSRFEVLGGVCHNMTHIWQQQVWSQQLALRSPSNSRDASLTT